MNPTRTCPKCAAPLPADAPQGHCPQCLLALAVQAEPGEATRAALEQATQDSGSSAPKASSPTLQFNAGEKVRYFGDYELLEEVARGGMGVVWKARQVSLNRTVALKMILSGSFASEAEVKRFRTEAEAAANLQHPNIVAIHEIGEHEGRHYFSMDFVEGRNLAHAISSGPLPPLQAATLLKTIAEAVHYAHQRGTLHRDLKPHNILVDPRGQPRITDFGLAKLTQQDSSVTQEGSVMGSPSYMPPEQATGRQADVGPASDVYSLGAILYQMLTGKVPFSGATAVDTLRAVVEQEPVAPSKLNDRVPADLETICLKCLEKKPERRYASARALAEELARFLNHEPILARPASAARKLVSWCQQRPWVLTGAAVFLVMGLIGLAFGLWQQNEFLRWRILHPNARVHDPWTSAAGFILLVGDALFLGTVFISAHWMQKQRTQPGPMPRGAIWMVSAAATAQLGLSVALALVSIRLLVWEGSVNESARSAAWSILSFAFALAWAGVSVLWRFTWLNETLGLAWWQKEAEVPFKLEVNWIALILAQPVLVLVTKPLARWLVGWGQFKSPHGFLANGTYVFDERLQASYEGGLIHLFVMMTLALASGMVLIVAAWGLPRGSEWRDLAPPSAFVLLGFSLMPTAWLPNALSAAGLLWGFVTGLVLLQACRFRRAEAPANASPLTDLIGQRVNALPVRRTLMWTWLGLVGCALLLVPGSFQTKTVHAILWICVATLGLMAAACRPKDRQDWLAVGAGIAMVLSLITDGFDNVRRFKALADPEFLRMMWPAFVAAVVIYRAAAKPQPPSDAPPKPQP